MTKDDWLTIIPGDLADRRIVDLLDHHVATALAASSRESCHAFDVSALDQPAISFWAAWNGEDLFGIGALVDLGEGQGEVKSMHTAETARGRGVGRAILCHIIELARARGFSRLSLETGTMDYFRPARALYAAHGFIPCPPFGDYRADPRSLYMTLDLAAERTAST
jgi:putative acetyltransferase